MDQDSAKLANETNFLALHMFVGSEQAFLVAAWSYYEESKLSRDFNSETPR